MSLSGHISIGATISGRAKETALAKSTSTVTQSTVEKHLLKTCQKPEQVYSHQRQLQRENGGKADQRSRHNYRVRETRVRRQIFSEHELHRREHW